MGNMRFGIIYCPVCDVINFEINFSFFIKSFSYMIKKVRTEWKAFFIIFKEFSLKQVKTTLLEGDRPTLNIFFVIIFS